MQKSLIRFDSAIKSEHTRKTYNYHLRKFLEYMKIRDHDGLLQLKEPFLQERLEDYLLHLRKNISPNSITSVFAPLELFFVMNDKVLNFKKIRKMFPQEVKKTGRDAWDVSDIKKMLGVAKSVRLLVLIHILASTGCRIGAIPELKLRHLKRFDDSYYITFYEGTTDEYIGFLTPEATNVLDSYLNKRKLDAEKLDDNSPLLRRSYRLQHEKVKPVTRNSIRFQMYNIIKKSGVIRTKIGKRYNIPCDHGFRKRFNTILKTNDQANRSLCEKLMGHSVDIPLDDDYLKAPIEKLYKEFTKHIVNLTIDSSERDRIIIEKSKISHSELDEIKKQLSETNKKLNQLAHKQRRLQMIASDPKS